MCPQNAAYRFLCYMGDDVRDSEKRDVLTKIKKKSRHDPPHAVYQIAKLTCSGCLQTFQAYCSYVNFEVCPGGPTWRHVRGTFLQSSTQHGPCMLCHCMYKKKSSPHYKHNLAPVADAGPFQPLVTTSLFVYCIAGDNPGVERAGLPRHVLGHVCHTICALTVHTLVRWHLARCL